MLNVLPVLWLFIKIFSLETIKLIFALVNFIYGIYKLTINYILFDKVLAQNKLVFKVWQLTLNSTVFRAVWQPIGKILGIKKNKVPLDLRFKSAKAGWLVPVFQFFCLLIMIKQTAQGTRVNFKDYEFSKVMELLC